jgi:hypothetical protein
LATILLANEFGTGLGHVNHLALLARRLDGRHRLVFALENPALAAPLLARDLGARAEFIAGPAWAPVAAKVARMGETRTLADPFDLFGLGDAETLGPAVARWDEILALHRPDLVIADAAPALRVAAAGRVPTVVVGSGYTVPPPGRPLPPIRPWDTDVPDDARACETRILGTIDALRRRRGDAPFKHLADVFAGDETFVCTLRDFDPYAAYRTVLLTWPYVQPLLAAGPAIADRDGADLFAYLPGAHALVGPVLEVLGRAGIRPQVFVSGADPRTIADRCRGHVAIHTRPADFAAVLPRCRLLIHHGGLATAFAGLMAGTPQLVLPQQLEHTITARGVALAGAGIAMTHAMHPSVSDMLAAIVAIRDDPAYAATAGSVADRLAREARPDAVMDIVAACERLAGTAA